MTIETIAGIIYQFTLNDNVLQTLSYRKYKAISDELLNRDSKEITETKINMAINLLISLGLIDREKDKDEILFRVTSPYKVSNNKNTIIINSINSANKKIYENINYYIIKDCLKDAETYAPVKILKAIPSITKIINKIFQEENSNPPSFRSLEMWSTTNGFPHWIKINSYENNPTLYKIFQVNEIYFEYYFSFNKNYYQIPKGELNTLNLIKSFIGLHHDISFFKFETNRKIINELIFLLEPVRKVVYTNHILSTGKVPYNKEFQIDDKIYNQIKRIYS